MEFLAITTVLLIIFNLVMWIVFAVKFKKIFTTDDVKKNINEITVSVYKTCSRYVDIVDEKIKQLKSVTAETERKIEEYRALVSKVTEENFQKSIKNAASKKEVLKPSSFSVEEEALRPRKTSSRTASSISARYAQNAGQGELFLSSKGRKAVEEFHNEKQTSQPVVQVPIVQPEFYMAETPVTQKKSFSQQVVSLHQKGFTDEEIASQLKRSVQEVKFSLEMS